MRLFRFIPDTHGLGISSAGLQPRDFVARLDGLFPHRWFQSLASLQLQVLRRFANALALEMRLGNDHAVEPDSGRKGKVSRGTV